MRPNRHPRMILAMLVVICAVIAIALYVQVPINMPVESQVQQQDQPAPADTAAQPTEIPVSSVFAPASTETAPTEPAPSDVAPAEPVVETAQDAESTQVSVTAAESPGVADVLGTEQPAPEKSAVTEDLQRQMSAAVSHTERPRVSPNAAYESGVVLVSVDKGTTAAQLVQAMADADVKHVDHNDIEVVTDDLMKAKLAPNATIDDAIYELESTGVARGAQPNYLYEIAEELTPVADAGLKREGATTPGVSADAEVAGPKVPVTPDSATEATAAEVQSDTQSDDQPVTNAQSTTPASARDFLNDTYANNQWGLDSIDALAAWEFPALKNRQRLRRHPRRSCRQRSEHVQRRDQARERTRFRSSRHAGPQSRQPCCRYRRRHVKQPKGCGRRWVQPPQALLGKHHAGE